MYPATYTEASVRALQHLRDPSGFHWTIVPLFVIVVYAYFNEIEKKRWNVVLASLGAYAAEWFAEIVNALWLHFSERSALWTTPDRTSYLIMVGINFDGRPIARYCGFTAGEGAIAFKTAYDESLRRYAPGMLAQVDMIRAFHERPELQWMDSYSDAGNGCVDDLWQHRLTVQRVAIAADARGELALALLPLMRLLKRFVGKLRLRRTARTIPSLRPA